MARQNFILRVSSARSLSFSLPLCLARAGQRRGRKNEAFRSPSDCNVLVASIGWWRGWRGCYHGNRCPLIAAWPEDRYFPHCVFRGQGHALSIPALRPMRATTFALSPNRQWFHSFRISFAGKFASHGGLLVSIFSGCFRLKGKPALKQSRISGTTRSFRITGSRMRALGTFSLQSRRRHQRAVWIYESQLSNLVSGDNRGAARFHRTNIKTRSASRYAARKSFTNRHCSAGLSLFLDDTSGGWSIAAALSFFLDSRLTCDQSRVDPNKSFCYLRKDVEREF